MLDRDVLNGEDIGGTQVRATIVGGVLRHQA